MKSITISLFTLLLLFLDVRTAIAQQTETLFDGYVTHGGFGGPGNSELSGITSFVGLRFGKF